jgi:hypothetical protein
MRNFINIINETADVINEFFNGDAASPAASNSLESVVSSLEQFLGQKLYRCGGPNRVYDITGGGGRGAVYVIGSTTTAIGLAWLNKSTGIRSIYVWYGFSLLRAPQYCYDLPKIDFATIAPTMVQLISHPKTGKVGVNETYKETRSPINEAKRTSEAQFVEMIRSWAGRNTKDLTRITYPDMFEVAKDNDVQIPGPVRFNKQWKTENPVYYNFSRDGGATGRNEKEKAAVAIQNLLGTEVLPNMPTDDEDVDPDFDTALNLAKVRNLQKMVGAGKIYITGRKNGKFFSFPSGTFEQIIAMVERLLAKEMADQNPDHEGKTSMEIQYEKLAEKVRLVAGGKSNFVKSLLITGGPSSGKSWQIMNIIKNELRLKEGSDYVIKKGSVTVPAMFRVLIEQSNGGLAIFDDCDSVTADLKGLNMLKGALDTDTVREVSYDKSRGIVNTAVMSAEKRDDYVRRLSDLLRGKVPTTEDVDFFEQYVPRRALKQTKAEQEEDMSMRGTRRRSEDEEEEDEFEDIGDVDFEGLTNKESKIIEYVMSNLPNKIDFKGRIIFISNMSADQFASQGKGSGAAIMSRAFYVDLNFESGEMLDYIEKIQDKISTPNLTKEDKAEVIEYIRERYSIGGIKSDINFRMIMISFDLRLTGPNWKRQINDL